LAHEKAWWKTGGWMISSQKLTSQRNSQNNITKKFKVRITSQEYHHRRVVMLYHHRRVVMILHQKENRIAS
jgi:hypothetical protein